MVPTCHTEVVHSIWVSLSSFSELWRGLVKGNPLKWVYAHSFSFHCVSVAKSTGELRLPGMKIKEQFLMLPAQIGNMDSLSKHIRSSALIESCLMYLRCNTLFDVQKTAEETGRWVGTFVWLICLVCLSCWAIITVQTANKSLSVWFQSLLVTQLHCQASQSCCCGG